MIYFEPIPLSYYSWFVSFGPEFQRNFPFATIVMKRFGRVVLLATSKRSLRAFHVSFLSIKFGSSCRLSVYPLIFDHQSFRRRPPHFSDDGASSHLTTEPIDRKTQNRQSKQLWLTFVSSVSLQQRWSFNVIFMKSNKNRIALHGR